MVAVMLDEPKKVPWWKWDIASDRVVIKVIVYVIAFRLSSIVGPFVVKWLSDHALGNYIVPTIWTGVAAVWIFAIVGVIKAVKKKEE